MATPEERTQVATIVKAEQDAEKQTYDPPSSEELKKEYDRAYYQRRHAIAILRETPYAPSNPQRLSSGTSTGQQGHRPSRPVEIPLTEMVNHSIRVLTSPKVITFDEYKALANRSSAIRYVLVAAIVTGIVSLVSGSSFAGLLGMFNLPFLLMGLQAGLMSFFRVFVNFIIFVRVAHFVCGSQSGVGSLNLATFFFSLFWVPILLIITFMPILSYCAWPIELIPLIFFGQVALRSSHDIQETGKATTAAVVASIAVFLISFVTEAVANVVVNVLQSAVL